MKAVSQSATGILNILTNGLNEKVSHRKINNAEPAFMPVTVEYLYSTVNGDFFSVCLYYELNGDLMRDPEIVFIRIKNLYFPASFQQDNMGLYTEFFSYDDSGKITGIRVKSQADCAQFCNIWMNNIKEQQRL